MNQNSPPGGDRSNHTRPAGNPSSQSRQGQPRRIRSQQPQSRQRSPQQAPSVNNPPQASQTQQQYRGANPRPSGTYNPQPVRGGSRMMSVQQRRAARRRRNLVLAVMSLVAITLVVLLVVGIVSCSKNVFGGSETTDSASGGVSDTEGDTSDSESETEAQTEPPQASVPEFSADLSAYEQYMNPGTGDDYLILVNTKNTIDEKYAPTDLIDVIDTRADRSARQMREYASKALEAFMIEARANGVTNVSVTSAYRPYSEQNYLFENRIAMYPSLSRDEAYAKAATVVAPPGTSEHQTGLCCDMHNLPAADVAFGDTTEGQWMAANCWKFGFVIRYPADKTDITGISYEPWHFRYVGRYHAEQMTLLGMCLEEYTEYLAGGGEYVSPDSSDAAA